MLVLSRKVGEKLVIGENIVVEVVRIRGNRITLALAAPQEVKIMRSELKSLDRADRADEAAKPLMKAC